MKPGDTIAHPVLGKGVIVAIYAKGGRPGAEVDFGYVSDWISAADLGLKWEDDVKEQINGVAPSHASGSNEPPLIRGEVLAARRGVLALKLGQILEDDVLQLSTGTGAIEKKLRGAVSAALDRRPSAILVEGPWGSGKTHILTMLRAIARKSGFATSSIILDGAGTELSDPMSLMEAILSSFQYPDERIAGDLRHKLARFSKSSDRQQLPRLGGRRLFDAITAIRRDALDDPEVVQVLEDYLTLTLPASHANNKLGQYMSWGQRLPPMRARSIDDRADRFCELLRGWVGFASLTGAKGLVLVIDELDVEYDSTRWQRGKRDRRDKFLRSLKQLFRVKVPLIVAFGSAPSAGDVPNFDNAVLDLSHKIGGVNEHIKAPNPQTDGLRELGRKIHELYTRAYPERLGSANKAKIYSWIDGLADHHMRFETNPIPRTFVRSTVEYLDCVS